MKKRILTTVLLFCAVVVFLPAAGSAAAGIGLFTQYIGGKTTWTGLYNNPPYTGDVLFNKTFLLNRSREQGFGFGFTADSCIDDAGIYNFRISLSYGRMRMATNRYKCFFDGVFADAVMFYDSRIMRIEDHAYADWYRLEIINAWALVRADPIRFWIGLQLNANYDHALVHYLEYTTKLLYGVTGQSIRPRKRPYNMVGFGMGIAIGLNIQVASRVSLLFQYGGIARIAIGGDDMPGDAFASSSTISPRLQGFEWYARAGVLYRL